MPPPITVPSIGARSMAVPADAPGGRAAEPAPLPDPADLLNRAWQAVWHLVMAAPVLPVLTAVTVLLAVAAGAVAGRAVDSRRRHAGARLLAVRPPAAVDAAGGEVLWRTMLGLHRPVWRRALFGQPHVAVELSADADGPRLAVWVPGGVPPGLVEHALTAAWPGTRVDDGPAVPPVPLSGTSTGGALRLASPGWYPLRARHEVDPARPLLAALSALQAGETACVQVLARPASRHRARTARAAAAKLRNPGRGSTGWAGWAGELTDLAAPTSGSGGRRGGGRSGGRVGFGWVDPWLADDLRAVKDKTAQPLFEVGIRYAVVSEDGDQTGPGRRRVRGLADGVASAFGAHTGRNRLARHRIRVRDAAEVLAGRRLRRGFLLSVTELAALAHLPYDTLLSGLEASAARRVAPLPRVPTTGKVLGDADAGPARPVAMTVIDSRTHIHVLGETGSGKSTLLAQLILGDAEAGRGVLAVDPQGDMVNDILDRLPTAALDRLVIIDPDDPAPPPSLNILDGPDLDLVADHAVGIMSRLFSAWWGPRTDDILRAAVLTLRDPSNDRRPDLRTLAAVPTLLTEPAFRRRATAGLTDPVLRGFWSDYDTQSDAARVQAAGPLLNKLRAVLLRPFVRATLAAGPSTVDMQKVLDGGICLVRLPKGSLGEDAARLLGSFLLARVWQTATHRARTGRAARIDCSVYLDECQNFLNLPHALDDMLAEARGYRLSLVLAHQHLGQLGPDLADGVSANARSKIFFTTSPEDARRLERHVAPRLAAHDLAHLDGYQAAARLLVDNRRTPAFTLRTRPLGPAVPGRTAAARAAAARNTAGTADTGGTGGTGGTASGSPGTRVRPRRAEDTGTGIPRATRPRRTGAGAAGSGGGATGAARDRTRRPSIGPGGTSQPRPEPRSDRKAPAVTRSTPTSMTAMTAMAGHGRRRGRQEWQRAQRPAVSADLLAVLAGRLTGRDRWMLGMLAEHRVLTTTQLTALAFTGRRETERRLAALWAWRCVDRFRPQTALGSGSAPFHWVLDDAGAAVLAAGHGLTDAEFGYRRATALAIAHSQRLSHTVGTNTLLTTLATSRLAASADADPLGNRPPVAGRLVDWWGERRCAAAWGDLVRPDAAASWQAPSPAAGRATAGGATASRAAGGRSAAGLLGFAVEYDTGTETLARVAAKLGDYADLAGAAGRVLPVLFWLPSVARESALHHHLDPTGLLVATAAADHAATAGGPTGPVWRTAAAPERGGDGKRGARRQRLTLDQLTAAWAGIDTLTIGSLDAGLGWPSPQPHAPRRSPGPTAIDRADVGTRNRDPDTTEDGNERGSRDKGGWSWGS